jgi:hypothetical protein
MTTQGTKKAKIPLALREEVWRHWMGEKFKSKCCVTWCTNMLTAFDFAVGHNIPESKGGTLELGNLRPICNRCNTSMGANYTIDEWNRLSPTPPPCCCGLFACFSAAPIVPPEIVEGTAGKLKNAYVPPAVNATCTTRKT